MPTLGVADIGALLDSSQHARSYRLIRHISFLIRCILVDIVGTSARLLRLLSFLQTPRDWTGAELAERLEVSPRTIRNDIERLRSLGYQVHATRGPIGGYRLASGTTVPPLLLEDDEAVALAVAYGRAPAGGTDGIEESSMRALAKLEQVLPARLRSRVSALQTYTVLVRRRSRRPVDRGRPDDARRDLPRPSRTALRLRGPSRLGQPATGRATSARPRGGALVPRRVGYRPAGLADVQGRPDSVRDLRRAIEPRRANCPTRTSPPWSRAASRRRRGATGRG